MANTLKVKVENEDVLTHAVVNGIDTENLIYQQNSSGSGDEEITMPADGWFIYYGTSNNSALIDGKTVYYAGGSQRAPIAVKKGQVVKIVKNSNRWLYGIKR